MKRRFNLIALVILVSVNVLTPISYAQEEGGERGGNPNSSGEIVKNLETPVEDEKQDKVAELPEPNLEETATPSAMDIISDVVEEYKETQQEEPKLDGENKVEEGNNTEEIVVPGENVDEGANLGAPVDADEGVVETMAEGTQTSQDGCYTYNLVDGGIEIVSYSGSCSKFVDLSNGIDGYDVISIASNAFYNKSVTGVVLGNTVETVSAYSFPFLEYIKIGKKVKYLGYNAFRTRERNENAYKYTDVEFEEGFDYDGLEVERGDNDNWAYDFQNSWFFILGGKNNCMVFDVSKKEIFEYICQENTVEIPMKISGFVVESIAESINCTKYSTFHNNIPGTLTLPSTIIKIGNEAACFIDGSVCMFSIDEGMENYLSTTELLPVIGSNLVRVKPYSGQELSPLLTDEMLSAACMYISEEHTVKFYDENGDFIKQITVEGNIDEEDYPVVAEKEGLQAIWVNQYGEVYNGEPITEDLDLYLKYVGIIHKSGDITYTDTNGNVFEGMGTITFTDGVKSITMLDRNLGATAMGTGEDSYGYYFQWGNNYGFLPGENEIDEERVDVTGYGWNNPYVSNVFVVNTGQRNYSELSADDEEEFSDGLWGGFGDYRDNTWDSSEGHDYMRQGPCPDGYHVPSGGEWIGLITIWSNENNVVTTPNDKLAINTSRHFEYYDFLEDFYVPLMGRMDYNVSISSEPIDGGGIVASIMENVKIKNKNKFAYAWSSSPYYLTADGGYELYGDSRRLAVGPNAKSHGSIERSNGFPVRCFKDNYEDGNEPLVLSYDTRGGSQIQAQTIPEGENEYLPGYTTHRTGYELLGWYDEQGQLELDGNKITNRTMKSDSSEDGIVTIYAKWNDDYVVTFKDYNGSVIKVVLVRSGSAVQAPANPVRDGYKFTGWDKDLSNVSEDMEVIAQYSSSSKGGYSGGGGSSSSKSIKSHNSADEADKTVLSDEKSKGDNDEPKKEVVQPNQGKTLDADTSSKETFNAHQWAYSKGLTKYRTPTEARMDDPLNRSEMAKISSIFAEQFLDKLPNDKKQEFCSQYPDLWKVEDDMKFFIIESCKLGYMGYESNGIDALAKFRPYTPVTVAEAATILSRIVWGNDNAMNGKDWYKGHLYATYNHGLIDNIKDPTKRSITRREAYLMLYRLIND